MDDIWWKAAKNLCKCKECPSAIQTGPETKPAAVAATTTTPAYPILNTVAQCNTRLLQMEFEWKLNRSGPFPDGIQNTIVNLCAVLVIQEAEALQQTTYETTTVTIPAPANAATPTTTSTPAAPVSTTPVVTPVPTSTAATDPNSNVAVELTEIITQMVLEQCSRKLPNNKENKGRTEGEVSKRQKRREKEGKGVEKEDRVSKQKNEQQEVNTGEQKAINGIQDEV